MTNMPALTGAIVGLIERFEHETGKSISELHLFDDRRGTSTWEIRVTEEKVDGNRDKLHKFIVSANQ